MARFQGTAGESVKGEGKQGEGRSRLGFGESWEGRRNKWGKLHEGDRAMRTVGRKDLEEGRRKGDKLCG